MGSSGPHDRIIHALCKEILLPIGVFQKGRSRLYLDDNGWYVTMIEFQPSGFSKGTYLNVGLHFLFMQGDHSFDYSDGDSRIGGFIAFENEEQFAHDIKPYVEKARDDALKYRAFRDVGHAKEVILRRKAVPGCSPWLLYHQAMICLLARHGMRGRRLYRQFLKNCSPRFKSRVLEAGYPQSARGMDRDCVMGLIRQKRAAWHSLPSLREMPSFSEFE